VKSVVEKFRGKYGTSGVNLYSKLDVAVSVFAVRSCGTLVDGGAYKGL